MVICFRSVASVFNFASFQSTQLFLVARSLASSKRKACSVIAFFLPALSTNLKFNKRTRKLISVSRLYILYTKNSLNKYCSSSGEGLHSLTSFNVPSGFITDVFFDLKMILMGGT